MALLTYTINVMLAVALERLTLIERCQSKTVKISSLLLKLSLAKVLNTTVVYFVLHLMNPIDPMAPDGLSPMIMGLLTYCAEIKIINDLFQPIYILKKWISNITDEEIRNLRDFIGIPFEEISTHEKAHIYDEVGNIVKTLGFFSVDASIVAETVEQNIANLEGSRGMKRFIAQIAMIGLWGSITRPNSDADKIAS